MRVMMMEMTCFKEGGGGTRVEMVLDLEQECVFMERKRVVRRRLQEEEGEWEEMDAGE